MSVRVIRSRRRRRTAEARLLPDGTLEVRVPAHLSQAQVTEAMEKLGGRLERSRRRRELNGDGSLERRARELMRQYFDGDLPLRSIGYVTNQTHRFGSCSPPRGTVRISHRVAGLPAWVRDYVIIHELAHLKEPNHSRRFWSLVERYPKAERARGYLMALGLEPEAGESTPDVE